VLLAGRGSSDNAARYAQYLLGAHNGLGVALAVPSLFTLYESPPRLSRALTIGVSQSGQSPDIVAVLREARAQGGITLALSNEPESPLSRAAEYTLPLLAGPELSVAATKTYSAQLFLLGHAERGARGKSRALGRARARAGLARRGDRTEFGPRARRGPRFGLRASLIVLGRGFNYSTAFEIALKLKETSYLPAEQFSVADLLHGPLAMIDQDFSVVLLAPSGRSLVDVPELLARLEARGARVLAISDAPDVQRRVPMHLALPRGVPEWLSPIVSVVPGQLFAGALAQSLGHDPDCHAVCLR